ncbi:hypothetical protein VTN02DRAFT_1423 [Thermoascus thermophilus]
MADNCSFKLAQAVGILGSAFASGGILSVSFLTVPAILLPARNSKLSTSTGGTPASTISHLTHQWLHVYDRGRFTFPALAAGSALAYTFLACTLHNSPGGRSPTGAGKFAQMYLAAAAATLAIVPYTLLFMRPTNMRLEARARRDDAVEREGKEGMAMSAEEEARRAREDRETPGVIRKWACLNTIRGIFPLVGAAVGMAAMLYF